MIEIFDEIKSKLIEAADIVNSFKSEAVQLRIVEYLLGNIQIIDKENNKEVQKEVKTLIKKDKKKETKKVIGDSSASKTKNIVGTGPHSMFNRLLESDFFKTPKTTKQMIQHVDLNFAKKIKANDISGRLARLVRNGVLTRVKNKDKQYEYKKA